MRANPVIITVRCDIPVTSNLIVLRSDNLEKKHGRHLTQADHTFSSKCQQHAKRINDIDFLISMTLNMQMKARLRCFTIRFTSKLKTG